METVEPRPTLSEITWPAGEPVGIRAAAESHLRVGPPCRCPRHRAPLEGGPVQYRCPAGHRVQAADLDHEFHGAVA